MHDTAYVPFIEEMKKDYTILVPNMLPTHFKLILSVARTYGYKMKLLENSGPEIAETGLKYVHNDACYPALLVVGQFMNALESGEYDLNKTALIMFQTGGGCRASNYISLIRKALKKAGWEHIPVISFSFAGLENHPGFQLNTHMLHGMIYAMLYGDLLMSLVNQVRPYELHPGDAEALADRWTERLGRDLGADSRIRYSQVQSNYKRIAEDFAAIPREERKTIQVGIVGEIFVKYSPLANNDLERFLIHEGAEVTVPGLVDFFLFTIRYHIEEFPVYGKGRAHDLVYRTIYRWLSAKRSDVSSVLSHGGFRSWTSFDRVVQLTDGYISTCVKMGEGWLLTGEMLELIESGCKNIVCTQPFGCLPNHICGKGMMKPIKERNPDVNIVAIDYDPGASRVNQENRLKLMLANAKSHQ